MLITYSHDKMKYLLYGTHYRKKCDVNNIAIIHTILIFSHTHVKCLASTVTYRIIKLQQYLQVASSMHPLGSNALYSYKNIMSNKNDEMVQALISRLV